MAWKYVILRWKDMYDYPIIFPEKLVHADVADLMCACLPLGQITVVGAGFIGDLTFDKVGGLSTSLGIRSGPRDGSIMDNYDITNGVVRSAPPIAALELHPDTNYDKLDDAAYEAAIQERLQKIMRKIGGIYITPKPKSAPYKEEYTHRQKPMRLRSKRNK
jgi:hypothetical protein